MAGGTKNIGHRRAVRALETKRDMLIEKAAKVRQELAATRAALKQKRKER